MVHAFSKTFSALALDELYDILRVRAEIFVVEQRCFYLDPDGVDKIAIHVGLRDDAGALVAYARLFPEKGGSDAWHVGRVLAVRRGEGLGGRVMEEVERVAALRGAKLLRMEAQRQAVGFYARLGWHETGPDFDEAGIPHVKMEKELTPVSAASSSWTITKRRSKSAASCAAASRWTRPPSRRKSSSPAPPCLSLPSSPNT